jgi:hypothetical protein
MMAGNSFELVVAGSDDWNWWRLATITRGPEMVVVCNSDQRWVFNNNRPKVVQNITNYGPTLNQGLPKATNWPLSPCFMPTQ